MTRFARPKGTNSTKEKKPEEPTSWQEMRKQLEVNQAETKSDEDKEIKSNWKHKINDDCAHEENKNSVWTKFDDKSSKNKKRKFNKKNKSTVENNDTELKKEETKKNKKSSIFKSEQVLELKEKSKTMIENDLQSKNKKSKLNKKKVINENVSKPENKVSSNVNIKRSFTPNQNLFYQSKLKNEKKQNEFQRRKAHPGDHTANINGKDIDIVCYEGFFIKKEDAEHLRRLRKKFRKNGIPPNELQAIMKLERRKAEKSLAREKKKVCFHCRMSGHNLSECPELEKSGSPASGICFKCGSTEHTYFECKVSHGNDFKFAQCFICKEEGHIAKQCPDNPRGLYPKGGACRSCGDVTHMKKDCPKFKQNTEKVDVTVGKFSERNLDALDEELYQKPKEFKKPPNKKIKFF